MRGLVVKKLYAEGKTWQVTPELPLDFAREAFCFLIRKYTSFDISNQGGNDLLEARIRKYISSAVVENANTFGDVDDLIGDTVSNSFILPTGDGITYTSSNEDVFKVVNGEAVVTRLKNKDVMVTLTVRVVSDEVAGDGYNYSNVDVTRTFTLTVPAKGK